MDENEQHVAEELDTPERRLLAWAIQELDQERLEALAARARVLLEEMRQEKKQ